MDRINISEISDTGSIPVSGTTGLVRKTEFNFDIDEIAKDTLAILDKYNNPQQISLMHSDSVFKSDYHKVIESIGSERSGQTNYDTFFTVFNDEFKDTSIYRMYQAINSKMNICRLRIMTMVGPSCYWAHKDTYVRYHLAVNTNPDCLFLFTDLNYMEHIPRDGYVYATDTRHAHTFVNASRQRRVHLVFGSTDN
jgi:Aspartyl/Asparaginyl beta-hydroxylase